MKYIDKIFSGVLLLASLMCSSCDDFLSEDNPNALSTDTFYTSINDCEMGHAALYNAFKDPNIYLPQIESMRSDLAVQGSKIRTGYDSPALLQTFNNSYSAAINKWAGLYTGVYRANLLIEGLENAYPNLTTDAHRAQWQVYKAEAYLFRGLFYFWLHNTFNNGIVPIKSFVPKSEADMYQPLPSSADVVKEFYRNDLKTALELGLAKSWSEEADKGRVTEATALALLGKSYLYDGDYKTAKEYFARVINDYDYSLADISENSTTKGEFNSESILEVSYTTAYNTEVTTTSGKLSNPWGNAFSNVGGWNSTIPALWLVDAAESESVDPANELNWIEIEVETTDANEDLLYTKMGKSYDVRTDNADGSYTIMKYVYKCKDKTTHSYEPRLFKKTITYSAANVVTATAYAAANVFYFNGVTVKFEGGSFYRLRQFSRRASYNFALNGDEDLAYYKDMAQHQGIFGNREVGYFRPLTNWDIVEKESKLTPQDVSSINLRLIRLADIYLMYAECCLMNDGDVSTALNYINKVRYRAGATLMGTNGEYAGMASYDGKSYLAEEVMKHLMYNERPLELTTEGQSIRVCDLRRWGVTKARLTELANKFYNLSLVYFLKPFDDNPDVLNTESYNNSKIYTTDEYNTFKTGVGWAPLCVQMSDFVQSASNYSDEDDAYWPIPNTEVMSNPYIK